MSERITWLDLLLIVLSVLAFLLSILLFPRKQTEAVPAEGSYIKWVEFNAPAAAMTKAYRLALAEEEDSVGKINWIDLLAYCAAKGGGAFKNGWVSDMDRFAAALEEGQTVEDLTAGMEYFNYYQKAYAAVLDGFVGAYWLDGGDGCLQKKFGLYAFSPIADGYGFSHYKDFGNSRSFGYQRRHLGNDLMASVGTPIVAIEGGVIEEMGWNRYGGWRIGIRSFDSHRYWYYAHLRKDHPYHLSVSAGDIVYPGQVIGYVGMTGYSDKENVNGMQSPHLHLGLQLIFDESQKDGNGEIWVDVYAIVKFLQTNRMPVKKDGSGDYDSVSSVYPVTWNRYADRE